jgi:hypothetical protein
MWNYKEDRADEDGAVQDAWNEHHEENPVHSFPTSLPTSATGSDTHASMREFAARAVLVDHQISLIRSDLTYCVRLNRMLMEERQRMIREDVLGVKDQVESRDRKASAELKKVVQDLFYGNMDTDFSWTTTPSEFYRRNDFERGERGSPLRRTKTTCGERTSPMQRTEIVHGEERTESPNTEGVRPAFGRPRSASQPLPTPYVDPAMHENKAALPARQLVSDLLGRFHVKYIKSDDVTVKPNESWAEGDESAEAIV